MFSTTMAIIGAVCTVYVGFAISLRVNNFILRITGISLSIIVAISQILRRIVFTRAFGEYVAYISMPLLMVFYVYCLIALYKKKLADCTGVMFGNSSDTENEEESVE